MSTRLRHVLSLLVVLAGTPAAAKGPACSFADIHPAYPPVNATPSVEATDVIPPVGGNCFPDNPARATWVTVASAIQAPLSPEAILQRLGAISELQQVQYGSTTDQAWRPMVAAAYAVISANTDAIAAHCRPASSPMTRTPLTSGSLYPVKSEVD